MIWVHDLVQRSPLRSRVVTRAAAVSSIAAALLLTAPDQAVANSSVALGQGRTVAVSVSYAGSGTVATRYQSTPPNPGGGPDSNIARDSGGQSWSLRFDQQLAIGRCGQAAQEGCPIVVNLAGATGFERATATIDHAHIDGLYHFDNAAMQCHVHAVTPRGAQLSVSLQVTLLPGAISVVAENPMEQALVTLPAGCPGQTDSLDGLLDTYATPGFSFNQAFGPAQWFTSAPIRIPVKSLERGTVRVPVAQSAAGIPPRGCDVPAPAYERCSTAGSWSGLLTFRHSR